MSETTTRPGVGYLHPDYAASLAEFGEPLPLPRSRTWLLTRPAPGSGRRDAMGCYPLFLCADWSQLGSDLDEVRDLVCVTVVTDPFGDVCPEELRRCFPDLARPFKEHFVVDLQRPSPSRHHRRNILKALRAVEVDVAERPESLLDEWERLYAHLRARRMISGIRAFSVAAFRIQLGVPGCVAFRALVNGQCIAMNLWYVMGDVAYFHLGASDEEGYRQSAAHALMQTAIGQFVAQGLRWLSLGRGAGRESSEDGLTRFKRGWATGTRQSYLCGRIFDRAEYARLVRARVPTRTDYFPAYRQGELA
jgi:hypothetical protein